MTRRFATVVALLALVLPGSNLSATADTAAEGSGRRWPRTACSEGPPGRPTILSAFFQSRSANGRYWDYEDALRALKRSRVPTYVVERGGADKWDDFATAGGTARRLIPAGRRLRDQRPPEDRLAKPQVGFDCAGHRYNSRRFVIWIPKDMHAREVIARHGGRERVLERWGFTDDGLRMWTLRRRPNSGVVQRAIEYLTDEDVYYAEVDSAQPLEPSSTD